MHEILAAFVSDLPGWVERMLAAAITIAIAVAAALLAHQILFRMLRRVARGSASKADDILVKRLVRPSRYALIALGLVLAARETPWLEGIWEKIAGFVMPALVGWMALAVLNSLVEGMELHAEITMADDRDARQRRTRLTILGHIGSSLIVFLTVGLMLLSIPGVRDIGVTLMASAGLAGLAVGAAAQPALKSLIAGIQMALTEPIRLGDLVVIEGESGRVEDIRLTYVVILTADERRLIVPTAKFLDASFQNWTRVRGGITGSVLLPIVPGHPIAPIRTAFEQMLAQRPEWDQRTGQLQVAEARVGSVELKLVMSAKDPAALASLRLAMREALLEWLRAEMPEALCREI